MITKTQYETSDGRTFTDLEAAEAREGLYLWCLERVKKTRKIGSERRQMLCAARMADDIEANNAYLTGDAGLGELEAVA